jgi:uncharacterized membrane protein
MSFVVVGLLYIMYGNVNSLMVLARASQHDCSSFVVLGRFILYQCNVLWPVSHKFD